MIEGTYEDTTSTLLSGGGVAGEIEVNVALTEEHTEPIVVYRPGGTDKQKECYKRHTPEVIVRRRASGRGS